MPDVPIVLVDLTDDLVGDVVRQSIEMRDGMTFAGDASLSEADRLIGEIDPEVVIFGTQNGSPPRDLPMRTRSSSCPRPPLRGC